MNTDVHIILERLISNFIDIFLWVEISIIYTFHYIIVIIKLYFMIFHQPIF